MVLVYAQMQLWQCVCQLCSKYMPTEAEEMFDHQEANFKCPDDFDFDVCLSSGQAAGHGSKRTWGRETDMHVAPVVGSSKMARLAPAVKKDLPGKERTDEDRESISGNAHNLMLLQQGGGHSKRPRLDAAEHVEVTLRVIDERGKEMDVVTRVQVDKVDLSEHTGLLSLPEALRGLTAMRELTVKSTALKTVP